MRHRVRKYSALNIALLAGAMLLVSSNAFGQAETQPYLTEPALSPDGSEIAFVSGGINHLAFLLRFERDGHDLYPRLREVVEADPEGLGRRVRVEVFRRLGFFPTESSEHNADLVPWFLPHGGPMGSM